MKRGLCWLNGEILLLDQACIPVRDHGLLYGDGVFEGIRFYHGRTLLLDAHLRRLQKSAKAIALDYAWSDAQLEHIIGSLIEASGELEGYIRLIITRGDGPLGIDPSTCPQPRLIVIVDALQVISREAGQRGANLIIASTRRLSPDGLDPRIKSLNYLNNILARIEANAAGADEAILLNRQGNVTEGTTDNIFIARNGRLLTPPLTDGALDGITRQLILELAQKGGLMVEESALAPYDLYNADECFLTGTGAELIPVGTIDGRRLPSPHGPVFEQCQKAFRTFIEHHCAERFT